jgi:hypothetical protein
MKVAFFPNLWFVTMYVKNFEFVVIFTVIVVVRTLLNATHSQIIKKHGKVSVNIVRCAAVLFCLYHSHNFWNKRSNVQIQRDIIGTCGNVFFSQ